MRSVAPHGPAAGERRGGTHRRERVIRPGKVYCLFLQGFAQPLIADKFP
jgi:hypothetical protein